MNAAIDFGLTNTDILIEQEDGSRHSTTIPTLPGEPLQQFIHALHVLPGSNCPPAIAITGGRYRQMPDLYKQIHLVKVQEVNAIGLGGLALAGLQEALVVSAGTGTAMVAARGKTCKHVTGSAVGGGTLLGLARLLLGAVDAPEIDRLALTGDANAVDLTLIEATGGSIGSLPKDANAVNFGRASKGSLGTDHFQREDLAAGLVRLIGQVIAVIAINAARAEALSPVVFIGHLVDLPSIRAVLMTVAGYYNARFVIPESPGIGTVSGALAYSKFMVKEQPE
ncbi:MAG TPA: hypothetical protein VIO61_14430 [Anaerolineaceae bacterium]